MNKDELHIGNSHNIAEQMQANQRDTALLHLIHDLGTDAEKYLMKHYNPEALIRGILQQRAAMTLNNTLYETSAEGKTRLAGKLDLAKLGISAEDMERIVDIQDAQIENSWAAKLTAQELAARAQGSAEGRSGR